MGPKTPAQIIEEVKGLGPVTAEKMERLRCNGIVAMAGVAPFNCDSGKFSGVRYVQVGRAKVLKCLTIAAHRAARRNPIVVTDVKKVFRTGQTQQIRHCRGDAGALNSTMNSFSKGGNWP